MLRRLALLLVLLALLTLGRRSTRLALGLRGRALVPVEHDQHVEIDHRLANHVSTDRTRLAELLAIGKV